MAKFDLSTKKRGRKVKRKKQKTTTPKEERKPLNLELIPISEQWPPDEKKIILGWEKEVGWFIYISAIARQHIEKDIQMFGYSRLRYWTFLE